MKKWFKSKESKKITLIICILFSVLVAQIIGFLYFNKKLYDMSFKYTMQHIEELSVYVEQNFQLELERYIQTLQVTELQMDAPDKIINQLQKVHATSNFDMMGISDLNGHGVDSSGQAYHISYAHIREYIEKDEVYISNVLKNGNETLIFIAVPLKINQKICGILWGKCALRDIANNVQVLNDQYKYFQIIDDEGHYLFSSKSKFLLYPYTRYNGLNIWEEMKKSDYAGDMSIEKLHESVRKGESGIFYFAGDQAGRYISYRPLKINNWYLFSIQVEDGLHAYVAHTRQIIANFFILLTVGLSTIFGVIYHLIYTMYKKIAKQHSEIQTINVLFQASLEQTKNIPFMIDRKEKQIVLYGYPVKDVTQCCSFADMQPETLVTRGMLDVGSFEDYKQWYQQVIVEHKICDSVIIYTKIKEQKEWIRINIISKDQENTDQIIGVLEDYGEQKEKDKQIESHLHDIKKIQKKSEIDFLTSLYNREAFLKKTKLALYENTGKHQVGALLILDLDHFKEVNDIMGHGMGDIVLQHTANTLRGFFRQEDIVGRLGGDEFVVFAKNIKDIPAFEQRIQELNHLLDKNYQKDDCNIQLSASIGIMLTDENHTTFAALYEKADQALYQVKHTTKNGYRFYSENLS